MRKNLKQFTKVAENYELVTKVSPFIYLFHFVKNN